jgi:hypothetical protein
MKSRKSGFANVGGIVFNMNDDRQRLMHDHLKNQSNYSSYLKSLIWNDICRNPDPVVEIPKPQPKPDPVTHELPTNYNSFL